MTDNLTTVRFRPEPGPWPTWAEDWRRAADLVASMTLDEKISLVSTRMSSTADADPDALGSAAYTPGIPRLGIPAWDESDASLGVTNPNRIRGEDDDATAFPSLAALGATFDRDLAYAQGQALGEEAREKGFAIQLAGGINLVREPRGGRIFEYVGEDVLHSGIIAGEHVAGIQSEGVVSTLKHFAVNPQETGRVMVSSDISEKNLRESDLLAFEIALELGKPRAIMPGYNQVNKKYAGENAFLLTEVLKGDWDFKGFAMSDWGATHSTEHAAWAGLDRQSGFDLDTAHFFGEPLRRAVETGRVAESRLDDMVTRILAALASVGALDGRRTPTAPSLAAHAVVAARIARESIVLLQNTDQTLPLAQTGGRVVVMGGRSEVGVPSGGGSSTVTPPDAFYSLGRSVPQMDFPRVHHRPAPLDAITVGFPEREVVHLPADPDLVRRALRPDDVAIVIVEIWATEGWDAETLSAGAEQDALVRAAAETAERTVVILETPGPVLLPWLGEVDAVLAAWFGGTHGAPALAAILTGDANPSGRLPVTFPAREADLPRPSTTDPATTTSFPGTPRQGAYIGLDYDIEGADVGYRWFERSKTPPMFAFGHGLSYTDFAYADVTAALSSAGDPMVDLTVTNVGDRRGADVPQVYIAPAGGPFRLAGWAKVDLEPGASQRVRLILDEARVYAAYDPDQPGWTRPAGSYRIRVARSAVESAHETEIDLPTRRWGYGVTG